MQKPIKIRKKPVLPKEAREIKEGIQKTLNVKTKRLIKRIVTTGPEGLQIEEVWE